MSQPLILIVDDDSRNLQILGSTLKQEGYQVMVSASGKHALQSLETLRPDLILLDVLMPELSGFEICKRIKANEQTADIPVIFITVKDETDNIVKGFELGAIDYVTKPFQPKELLARVKTHLDLSFSRGLIERQSQEYKELLHILCHDLNNPLWGVAMVLENAEKDPGLLQQKKGQMLRAITNCLAIVKLVRQVRVLEDKEFELPLTHLSLKDIVSEAMLMLEDKFLEKQIKAVATIPEGLNILVEKSSLINSVLNNLLTNSIKFSYPNTQILVTGSQDKDHVFLTVQDFGIGIPEAILRNLFDIRKRTSRTGTQGETGTGFGMPLIQKFMKKYGGSIKVVSKDQETFPEAHGTLITLTFQAEQVESTV
ncbi:hybrid sensor histidine kinase/response regulator [Deltaproteobacteria bacterium TL4]